MLKALSALTNKLGIKGYAALEQNIVVTDVTGYGSYGWATNSPVKNIEEAKSINFRIAQAPVNIDFYKAWGLKFTVMPWPAVPQPLHTGVITALHHLPIVSPISAEMLKDTKLDYVEIEAGKHQFIFLNPNDPEYRPPTES